MRPQGLRPGARAPTCLPFATPLGWGGTLEINSGKFEIIRVLNFVEDFLKDHPNPIRKRENLSTFGNILVLV